MTDGLNKILELVANGRERIFSISPDLQRVLMAQTILKEIEREVKKIKKTLEEGRK